MTNDNDLESAIGDFFLALLTIPGGMLVSLLLLKPVVWLLGVIADAAGFGQQWLLLTPEAQFGVAVAISFVGSMINVSSTVYTLGEVSEAQGEKWGPMRKLFVSSFSHALAIPFIALSAYVFGILVRVAGFYQ